MRCPKCDAELTKVGSFLVCGEHGLVTPSDPPAAYDTAFDLDLDLVPFPVAYPLALARDLHAAPEKRINNAIFAAYQAMRVTGLVLLADYLDSDGRDLALGDAIRGLRLPHWREWTKLCRELVRFWASAGDVVLETSPSRPSSRSTYFPALCDGWREVDRLRRGVDDDPWASLLAGRVGERGPAVSANDAIWHLRNALAHQRGAWTCATSDRDAQQLMWLLPLVERAVATLFPPGSLTLFRRVDDIAGERHVIRLLGAHLDAQFPTEHAEATISHLFDESEVVALASDGVALPVFPFVLPLDDDASDQPMRGGGLIEHAAMVDGVSDKRVRLRGVERYASRVDLAGPVTALLRAKQVDLGLDRENAHRRYLAEYAELTAQNMLGQVTGRKYFPESYLDRAGIDAVFEEAMTAGERERGRAVLVIGEAGSGKSSLLARFVGGLLEAREGIDIGSESRRVRDRPNGATRLSQFVDRRKQGDVVLYLQGRSAYDGDAGVAASQVLCDAVCRQAGIRAGAFTSLEDLLSRLAVASEDDKKRRVWLVLDALNEAARFTDLVKALNQALPAIAEHPWMRLVVSMRTGAWESLRRHNLLALEHGAPGFTNISIFEIFGDGREPETPLDQREPDRWLTLRPFSEAEAKAAYELRQGAPEGASALGWEELRPEVRRLLGSPLHLHLFHETFRDSKSVAAGLDETKLFEAYLDRLTEDLPGLRVTLADIGGRLYERRRPDLPAAEADEMVDRWSAPHGGRDKIAKLDPIEELVAASVLMRPSEEGQGAERSVSGYVFTHQRLAEQILFRELRRRLAPARLPDGDLLFEWATRAIGLDGEPRFMELAGALALFAPELVEAGRGDTVARLLDIEDKEVRVKVLSAVVEAIGLRWGRDPDGGEGPRAVLSILVSAATEHRAERLAEVTRSIGESLALTGHRRASEAILNASLTGYRRTVEHEPDADIARHYLCMALMGLARRSEDPDAATALYREALDVLDADALLTGARLPRDIGHYVDWALEFIQDNIQRFRLQPEATHDDTSEWLERAKLALRSAAQSADEDSLQDCLRSIERAFDCVGRGGAQSSEEAEALEGIHELRAQLTAFVKRLRDQLSWHRYMTIWLARVCRVRLAGVAEDTYQEAVRVVTSVLATDGVGATDSWTEHVGRLERLASRGLDPNERATFFTELLVLVRELLPVLGDTGVRGLGMLSELADSVGQSEVALALHADVVKARRRLFDEAPGDASTLMELADSLDELASMAKRHGHEDEALAASSEALVRLRDAYRMAPGRRDIKQKLATHLEEQSDAEGGALKEAVALRREIVYSEPQRIDLKEDLAGALERLGQGHRANDDWGRAWPLLAESLRVRREIVDRDPDDRERADDLVEALRETASDVRDVAEPDQVFGLLLDAARLSQGLDDTEQNSVDDLDVLVMDNAANELRAIAGDVSDHGRARDLFVRAVDISRDLARAHPERRDLAVGLLASLLDLVAHLIEGAEDTPQLGDVVAEMVVEGRRLVERAQGDSAAGEDDSGGVLRGFVFFSITMWWGRDLFERSLLPAALEFFLVVGRAHLVQMSGRAACDETDRRLSRHLEMVLCRHLRRYDGGFVLEGLAILGELLGTHTAHPGDCSPEPDANEREWRADVIPVLRAALGERRLALAGDLAKAERREDARRCLVEGVRENRAWYSESPVDVDVAWQHARACALLAHLSEVTERGLLLDEAEAALQRLAETGVESSRLGPLLDVVKQIREEQAEES
ncbi:MAG: ATP-binding protein [Deltaproteobacteria bacterium]|nr:MAG: ATP-binding protein [Deltaproteobacteria bacterium]